MAANYKVNIELNTKKLDKQLKDLGVKVDKVGKVKQSQSKKTITDNDKEIKQEIQQIRLTNEKLGIETSIKKIRSQIKDIGNADLKIKNAETSIDAKQFDLAKKELLLGKQHVLETKKELAAEKKVTAEKVKQVNLQSAGMNLIRLSGRAGKLGGRTAAVIDQQTALRQPKGLPSASMLNAEARGIKRLGTTPSIRGFVDPSNPQISGYTASSAKKAAFFEDRINKARLRGIENNKNLVGSERLRNKQLLKNIKATEQAADAEARRLNRALRTPQGPSSMLNYRGGQLLPGPAGAGRGGGLTSALISGAFPLLFGQGPLAAAGGFTGGLIGDKLGGQMGGFAGGLIGTAVVTSIQNFTVEIGKLGAALNSATKDVTAISAALGITGTEFEKQLQTLSKLGDEEAAFEAARQKMVQLVGQDGVNALTKFGDEFTELGNNFAKIMTLMKTSFANFLQYSGIGKFLASTVENTALLGQADAYGQTLDTQEGKRMKELIEKRQQIVSPFGPNALDPKARTALTLETVGREKGKGLFGAVNLQDIEDARKIINDEIIALQKKVNIKNAEAEADKMIEKIQKARVKNIDREIELLERSFTMTSDEFEIEQEIAKIKEDDEIKDEAEIRNKLKKLQLLQKERQLADETAAAFERMSQTIATDISDGIKGMIRGTSTLNDMLNNVLNKLIDAAFNMAMFGNVQGTLGGGGLLGSIFSGLGLGSGSTSSPDGGRVSRRVASGGTVKRNSTYLVGEKGPELFSPGATGVVTPNHAMGAMNIVVNVDASGSSVEGDEEQGRELGRMISAAIQSELIKQKRPGGMLA